MTLAYIVLLVVAGIRAHSLALLSEAGHNLSDFLALLLSLVAVYFQSRPPSATKTYGYHRAGVLAALVNASSLVVVSFFIFYEAFRRLQHPGARAGQRDDVGGGRRRGDERGDRSAALSFRRRRQHPQRAAARSGRHAFDRRRHRRRLGHPASPAITGSIPCCRSAIGVLILWSGFGIVRETLNILLEGTPRGMKLEKIETAIRSVEGVNDVHDLHVWSIGSETHALSCHISIADIPPSVSERILRDVKERLLHDFRIDHTTIQFEHVVCEVAHGCVIPVVESAEEHHHSH